MCTADEMMAGRGEEEEEEEGGVHVQGGQYFGTGSYVSTYHASILKHYLFDAPLFSPFSSTSPPALFVQRARLVSAIQRRRHNIIQLSYV